MVDLSKVKVGDTVVFRNKKISRILNISKYCSILYDYTIKTGLTGVDKWLSDGHYFSSKHYSQYDIVHIIPCHEKNHSFEKGKILFFRGDISGIIADVTVNQFGSYPLNVLMEDGRNISLTYDGSNYIEGCSRWDVVQVMDNPHNKTLNELILDGFAYKQEELPKVKFFDEDDFVPLGVGMTIINGYGEPWKIMEATMRAVVLTSLRTDEVQTLTDYTSLSRYTRLKDNERLIFFRGQYGIETIPSCGEIFVRKADNSGFELWPIDS